jgi:hypothetical protein
LKKIGGGLFPLSAHQLIRLFVLMMWKNENYSNCTPAYKTEYVYKCLPNNFSLTPNNYRDNILDLMINEQIKTGTQPLFFAGNILHLHFFANSQLSTAH